MLALFILFHLLIVWVCNILPVRIHTVVEIVCILFWRPEISGFGGRFEEKIIVTWKFSDIVLELMISKTVANYK